MAHGIPKCGHGLPLVKESGCLASEYQLGISQCQLTQRQVSIEKGLATGATLGGLGFPHGLGAIDHHCPGPCQLLGQRSLEQAFHIL